ncbi:hypothetical protein BDC45DRAFT_569605 [Circinella umbellata]|nr:hypothetical protein BDC45DRAFT_569605 [Circinella umbellata]
MCATSEIRHLQKLQNKLCRRSTCYNIICTQIPAIEAAIAQLQQEQMDNLALRASVAFRERGEKSVGYLKRTIKIRSAQRAIPSLQHPDTNIINSSIPHLHNSVCSFYSSLYTPTLISQVAVDDLLTNLSPSCGLSPQVRDQLTAPITIDELLTQALKI